MPNGTTLADKLPNAARPPKLMVVGIVSLIACVVVGAHASVVAGVLGLAGLIGSLAGILTLSSSKTPYEEEKEA